MSTESQPTEPLATTLFGQTRRRILSLLYGRTDEEFYVREIARTTGTSPGAVQRELRTLQEAGIIRRRARGSQVYYGANPDCPIYGELRDIMIKTAGLADVLRAALAPLRDRIRVAFVFGSFARSEARSGSDVDLMLVGDIGFAEAATTLREAQSTLGRDVNPVVYSEAEFRRRTTSGDHFVGRVLDQPLLFLFGDTDELVELGAERLAGRSRDE